MPRRIEEPTPLKGRAVPPVSPPTEPAGETRMPAETAAAPAPTQWRRPRRATPTINITDAERAASVAGGALLALYGLGRRSWAGGFALAGLGGLLLYRGLRGHSYVYERIGVERAGQAMEVEQAITVNRPVAEVYAFWRKLENLPRFMRHLRSVTEQSATRSHWVAQAIGTGRALEWDSEITDDRPNERIRWRSLPDGGLEHRGEVRFKRAPGDRGTEVHVHLEYRPPLGAALGAAMYPFTRQTLKEEIRRLKHVLETGELPTTEGQPSGRRPQTRVQAKETRR